MEKENKKLYGYMLGQLYRVLRRVDPNAAPSKATIFGLVSGIEPIIDEELGRIGWVSNEQFASFIDLLDEIWSDREKMERFGGYYDIEHRVSDIGLDRGDAITLLSYLYENGQFIELIDKMNSSGSPVELKKPRVSDYEV